MRARKLTIELTARELKLIRLVCSGVPRKAACSEIGVGRTRFTQLMQALRDKLGLTCNEELIVWAVRRRIV